MSPSHGRIIIDLFTTLDGVAQAPGGPDEDLSNGFRFGGWQAPYSDAVLGQSILAGIEQLDALLLGRRTYDIFAAYWPHEDGPVAAALNGAPKYIASRDPEISLEWSGSERVGTQLADEVRALRERHREIHVIGSVDLVQTLLAEQLFDELRLWVYPVVLGEGKKVFPDGAAPSRLRLLEPPLVGDSGGMRFVYGPVPGVPETGTVG